MLGGVYLLSGPGTFQRMCQGQIDTEGTGYDKAGPGGRKNI